MCLPSFYRPAALLLSDGDLVYVDADGRPFLKARSDDLDYPVITGIDPSLGEAHPALPLMVTRDALTLLDALERRGLVESDTVSELAFHRARGVTVHLNSGAQVAFALDGTERQLRHLAALLDRGVGLDRPVMVDLAPRSVAIVRPLKTSGGEG